MSSCKAHIFISFPCMSTTFDTDLIFSESVFQLIQRLLTPIGIKDISIFNLYGYSKNFRKIQPNELCHSLFASEYEKFAILQSDFDEIDIYFENSHGYIGYNKNLPVSNLAETSMYCFTLARDASFYVVFDPMTNSLISMKEPSTSRIFIIKTFYALIPGMVFDLFTLSRFDTQSLTIEDMSRVLFTKPMHHLFRSLRDQKNLPFEIASLTPQQISKCVDSFKDESHIADLTHEEQTSFLFMLLSSGEHSLVSTNLQQLAIDAMKAPNDITALEMAKVFLMYTPFSTHMILIELVQLYGGGYTNVENHDKTMSILTEVFFKRKIDREIERKFISFLFLFYQYLLPIENVAKSQSKICIYNQKLVLFDYMSDQQVRAFTIDGPSDINIDQTTPLVHNPPIKELLDKYIMRGKGISQSNQGDNTNSAQECIEIYKRINQKLKDNYPREVLYPFFEYLDDLNLESHKILT